MAAAGVREGRPAVEVLLPGRDVEVDAAPARVRVVVVGDRVGDLDRQVARDGVQLGVVGVDWPVLLARGDATSRYFGTCA